METLAEFASEGEAAKLLRQIFTQPQTMQGPVTLPPIEDVGEEQGIASRKEENLIKDLKRNLREEIDAAITRERPRLPHEPKELEKKYLEQMSFVGASLAYVTLAIRAAPRPSERRTRLGFLRSQPEPAPESDEISEMLKGFRRLQPNLAERSINLWEKFQEYKDWKRWYTNGDMNIPPPGSPPAEPLHHDRINDDEWADQDQEEAYDDEELPGYENENSQPAAGEWLLQFPGEYGGGQRRSRDSPGHIRHISSHWSRFWGRG